MLRELILSAAVAFGPAFQNVPVTPPVVADRVENTIYIGDSRFNGMEIHVGKGEGFVIAKDCMGYYWLSGDVLARAERIRTQHPEAGSWTLVSNLGVNDLDDIDLYIRLYRQLEDMGYRVVVVSVNPSNGKRTDLNKGIDKFNKKMEDSGLEYLDLCSHLRDIGFDTTDGLHYQKGTSIEIWNEINTYLANNPAGRQEDGTEAANGGQAGEAASSGAGTYSKWLCLQPAEAEIAAGAQDAQVNGT